MWKYYWALLKEVPRLFRHTVEALTFWVIGGTALTATIWPYLRWIQDSHPIPTWIGPGLVVALVVYRLLGLNFRRVEAKDVRIAQLESLPTKKYQALCVLQEELVELVRIRVTAGPSGPELYERSRAFWNRVESELFPYLHQDEKTKLRELFHHPSAWKKTDYDRGIYNPSSDTFSGGTGARMPSIDDLQQSISTLHGVKNLIDSWVQRDRPPTIPPPR